MGRYAVMINTAVVCARTGWCEALWPSHMAVTSDTPAHGAGGIGTLRTVTASIFAREFNGAREMTMRKTTSIVLVFFLCLMVVPTIARADEAMTLYKAKCVMCHAPDGSGDTPMGKKQNIRDLRSPKVQSQTDAVLTEMIATGGAAKKASHAYKTKGLTDGQITALVKFIRKLKSSAN